MYKVFISSIPESINLRDLSNKRVAIDTFLVAYQFITSIRARGEGQDGGPLRDSKGRPISHLMGFLDRATVMIENGIDPIFIFDGTPHDLKLETLDERKERKKGMKKENTKRWATTTGKRFIERDLNRCFATKIPSYKEEKDFCSILRISHQEHLKEAKSFVEEFKPDAIHVHQEMIWPFVEEIRKDLKIPVKKLMSGCLYPINSFSSLK